VQACAWPRRCRSWRLETPDELLVEGVSWTNVPSSFDFKERSIPAVYARQRHYYRKVSDLMDRSPESNGEPVVLSLNRNEVKITCRLSQCMAHEIVAGRRSGMRSYGEAEVFSVPLAAQTTIEFGSR
jgi:hypothetical protein